MLESTPHGLTVLDALHALAGMARRLTLVSLGLLLSLLVACGGGSGGSEGESSSSSSSSSSTSSSSSASSSSSSSSDNQVQPPVITVPPVNATVIDGAAAQFSVTAGGSGTLSYQWLKNGNPIGGATQAALAFTAVHATDDGASYAVRVSNSAGPVTSPAATLTVTPVAVQITSAPADITVQAGSNATFAVITGAGTQPISYQWLRNGTAISGATSSTLTLNGVSLADSGALLSVVVGNAAGSVTAGAARLTVTAAATAPTITVQPQSVTVLAGRTASFSVTASGSTPLSYQWYRDGTALSGATQAGYTTPVLAYTDGATYTVVVSNVAGSVTSQPAVLTVSPRVVQVSAGGDHAAARKEDGSVWSWGYSSTVAGDALGAGPVNRSFGTMVKAVLSDGNPLSSVSNIAAGYVSSVAIKADGSVWAWGQNREGEVGNGITTKVDYPVQVKDVSGNALSGFTAASGGYYYTLALKADGTAWAWGYASMGILGNNNTGSAARNFPSPVAVLDNTGAQLSSIAQIDAGEDQSVALTRSGTVWAWGAPGQVGDGQVNVVAYVAKPLNDSAGSRISGVTQVSSGKDHSLLLKSDGTVWGWGLNARGQLGGGSSASTQFVWARLLTRSDGSTFGNVKAVQAGRYFSVLLRDDGTVWTVGQNNMGQLGNGSTVASSSTPVQVTLADGTPLGGVTQISVHDSTVIVLRDDSTVWGWGNNAVGQLGVAPTNLVQFYATPRKISVSGD